jgi:hypothetical protein
LQTRCSQPFSEIGQSVAVVQPVQIPALQPSPGLQAWPQVPQLASSSWVLVQTNGEPQQT